MDIHEINYSTKNIPTPSRESYLKILIDKMEEVIRRMRWKAMIFDGDMNTTNSEKFNIKSSKYPPKVKDLALFEANLLDLFLNIQFKNVSNPFQKTLANDIKKIRKSKKIFVFSDKTKNLYEIDKIKHKQLIQNSITDKYKLTDKDTYNNINDEAKILAKKLNIDDRIEQLAKREAFITLKDHKPDFNNRPTCRLINPAKTELGLASKDILRKINTAIRNNTNLFQWTNTTATIDWFNKIPTKKAHKFTQFDIVDFYPSITEQLLSKALDFAKKYTSINKLETEIIMHSRRTLLFSEGKTWVKKDNPNDAFDVSMGSYDSADVCDVVGLYLLDSLIYNFPEHQFGIYRDDGLCLSRKCDGHTLDKLRKNMIKHMNDMGLKITIDTNLTNVNFLDVNLDLDSGTYKPYHKPNEKLKYINTGSCHPPIVFKNLVHNISRRISNLSANKEIFDKAAPYYNKSLKESGFKDQIKYIDSENSVPTTNRNRKRKIIWFTPPYALIVRTNIGKKFLELVKKHFPPTHRYHKIFNKNTVKISYSCGQPMKTKFTANIKPREDPTCTCRNKEDCPLQQRCNIESIIYQATIKTDNIKQPATSENYIGMVQGSFKQRYYNHLTSFKHENKRNVTALSNKVWEYKKQEKQFKIEWKILDQSKPYVNG